MADTLLILLLACGIVTEFVNDTLADSSPTGAACADIISDFRSLFLKDGQNRSQPVFIRTKPVLVQQILINVADCPDYNRLRDGDFTIKFMDVADSVLQGEFKTLLRNPAVHEIDNPTFPNYNLVLRIDGEPPLTHTLRLDSNIESTCAPEVLIKGCSPNAKFCESAACLNGGSCVGFNKCSCPKGFGGDRCENIFSTPNVYNMDLGWVSYDGVIQSVDGSFGFNLVGDISFVKDKTTEREAGDRYRRKPDGHGNHHGSFHIHGQDGTAACHHHSHGRDCNHLLHGQSFTSSCHVNVGHGHNGHTSLFSTNHGHGNHMGASLVYSNNNLNFHVAMNNAHCNVNVPHGMQTNQPYSITSSYSVSHGCSLFVNGQHLGSQTAVPMPHNLLNTFTKPHNFCIGTCAPHSASDTHDLYLSNLMFVAEPIQSMVTNGVASLLDTGFDSSIPPNTTYQPTTTTTPSRSKVPPISGVVATKTQSTTTTPPRPRVTPTSGVVTTKTQTKTATTTRPRVTSTYAVVTTKTQTITTTAPRSIATPTSGVVTTKTQAITTAAHRSTVTPTSGVVTSSTQTTFPHTISTTPAPTTAPYVSSPICFDCGSMSTDDQCKHVRRCSAGEICLVYEEYGNFTHTCLEKNTCFTAKLTLRSRCWECCESYLCNVRCPVGCSDTKWCATVRATGYDVCGDADFAKRNCQQSCNHCTASG